MNPWRPLPLLRLVIPFVAGIIAGQLFNISLPVFFLFSLMLPACLALFLFHLFVLSYRLRWMTGSLILFAFFISGFQLAHIRSEAMNRHFQEFGKAAVLLVRVSDCPSVKPASASVVTDIVSFRDSGIWKPLNTKLYLRLYGKNANSLLSYGSYYMVYSRPEPLKFFHNTHSFNFREYLFSKGVRYETGIRVSECVPVSGDPGIGINGFAFMVRDRLLRIFKDKGLAGQEFSVAAALLLGYVNEIDSRLKSAFAASGTMHILSVSGMHVGIIFLFLETLLSFLTKFRHGIYLKLLIQLLIIWAYAAVTGFSPAVLRAATCLSFLIAGKAIKRKPEMLNVISASVFFLLIMDPSIISDVGFQLSYLAVIGIVLLYKPIYDLYVTHYWLPDKIWALVAVSIAAQIATFPLSLYYFHRFPNYFILSNLLIVPLSNGIILMGILGLLCSSIPFIGGLAISALKLLLTWLNKSVLWIGSLPGAVTSGFFPTMIEVCLLYLLFMGVFLFLTGKRPKFLLFSLSCLITLGISGIIEKTDLSSHCRLAIHQGRQGYVIRFIKGRKEICFYSGLRMMKDPFIAGQIGNERMAGQVNSVQERWVNFNGWKKAEGFPEVGRFGNMLITGGRRVYILDVILSKNFRMKAHTDILLISRNTPYSMELLKAVFSPVIIINLSTASHSRVLIWSDQARRLGLKFYDLRTTGFYEEEL
ncbi:MAG: ComEC/Rec2 family competence protein [Bacteroidetes bacterium]|nr:ComEC/Rec2 family competence protein [Bacteroidota bacterium]